MLLSAYYDIELEDIIDYKSKSFKEDDDKESLVIWFKVLVCPIYRAICDAD
jgi:hypothetical protein